MSAYVLLDKLVLTTTPTSLTSELTVQSADTKKLHVLSRFVPGAQPVERDLMARVIDGNPVGLRFLLEQRIDLQAADQRINLWLMTQVDPNPKMRVFSGWDALPGTELRNFDFVLPFPKQATLLDPAPAPSGPGPMPPAGCAVVELGLDPTHAPPGSDRIRLWIDDSAGRTIDHRAEHYNGATLVRVVTAANWVQLPGTANWGPVVRTTTNVATGKSTTVTVTSANPAPIPANTFMSAELPKGTW